MQDNSKIIAALSDIMRALYEHPDTMRGNSKIHYCYHRAISGLRAIEPQDEKEARDIASSLENWGITARFDNTTASVEGWRIIEVDDVPTIEHIATAGYFEDDRQVWAHIAKNALTSEYHANALRFIKRENPKEFEEIAAYVLYGSLKTGE